MFSGAVSRQQIEQRQALERNTLLQELLETEEHFARWTEHPSSHILHHESACCEEARLWFLAYGRSMEIGTLSQFEIKAPTWLTKRFTWGPSEWPISWCQVVREKIIDCGVFAALAREIFAAQGHQVHPAQALFSYNRVCTDHWKSLWKTGGKKKKNAQAGKKKDPKRLFPWVGNEIVYHELCLLEMPDGTARFYDSSWGIWHEPSPRIGFGALLAVRSECPRLLRWGNKLISHGEWMDL